MEPEGKSDVARRNKRLAMIHVGIVLAILAAFVIKQSLA